MKMDPWIRLIFCNGLDTTQDRWLSSRYKLPLKEVRVRISPLPTLSCTPPSLYVDCPPATYPNPRPPINTLEATTT